MSDYPIQTVDTAADGAGEQLAALRRALGFVPNAAGVMANSAPLLRSFLAAFGHFRGAGTFTPAQRQVLLLTNAVTNNCPWAVAFHSYEALQAGRPRNPPGPPNVLRRMFHPDGVRPHVANWPEVAEALVRRVRREAIGGATDERAQRILDEVLAYPDVPAALRALDPTPPTVPVVPIRYVRDDRRFDYFSMVTTLGTAQDVTLQELRIECFFPANEATRSEARRLRP